MTISKAAFKWMPVLISTRYHIPIPQFTDITYSGKKILHIIRRICGSVEITGFVLTLVQRIFST